MNRLLEFSIPCVYCDGTTYVTESARHNRYVYNCCCMAMNVAVGNILDNLLNKEYGFDLFCRPVTIKKESPMTPDQLINIKVKCNYCGKEIQVVPYDGGISIIPCDCKNVAKYYTNGLRIEEDATTS